MGDVEDLASRSIEALKVSESVKTALKDIQAELLDAYREAFVEMVETMKKQASQLDRIQTTLNILVQHLEPKLEGKLPVAFTVAKPGTEADVATAVIVADPIGSGFTLSQRELSDALGVSQVDVSILVRGFKLTQDGECAVRVRQGGRNEMVNYHPRAVARFRELVANPPSGLKADELSALRRVRARLARTKPEL